MATVNISFGSFAPHNYQILTGFDVLTDGLCAISSKPDTSLPPYVVTAELDGKVVVYDTCDGYDQDGAILNDHRYIALASRATCICKRDYSAQYHDRLPKELKSVPIVPLAPNYLCTNARIRGIIHHNPVELLRYLGARVLGRKDAADWKSFEGRRTDTESFAHDVLFITRLYDPDEASVENDRIRTERIHMNSNRIDICRALKQAYGERAIVGLKDTAVARKLAPDLILNRVTTRKGVYRQLLHETAVCVTSLGLHQSNGWKFAEYIAAGKAIVTERPVYEVPYAQAGQHWLEFTNPNECVMQVDTLLQSHALRTNIQEANLRYYTEHLSPDRVIADSLSAVNQAISR